MHISGRQPLEASLFCFVLLRRNLSFAFAPHSRSFVLVSLLYIYQYLYICTLANKRGNADPISRAPALRTFLGIFIHVHAQGAVGKDVGERKYGFADGFWFFGFFSSRFVQEVCYLY